MSAINKERFYLIPSLVLLTFLYFIVELIVNASIFLQLSGLSDAHLSEAMELWGKIIAGFGLGLLFTRYIIIRNQKMLAAKNHRVSRGLTLIFFFLVCIFTIPASFILQNKLISYVVDNSSDEDRNKAILIMATHGTIVPFYSTEHKATKKPLSTLDKLFLSFYNEDNRKHGKYSKEALDELAIVAPCSAIAADSLGITNSVDKAFFPYLSLLSDIDESVYKNTVNDYYSCNFQDRAYLKEHLPKEIARTDVLEKAFREVFVPAVNEYDTYKRYKFSLSRAKAEADKQWREALNEKLGFKTTIKPKYEYGYFVNHPDIKRWYIKKTGIKDVYPVGESYYNDGLKFVLKNLPALAIPAYIDETGERSELSKKLSDEQISEVGKKAYKAIVMPFIAIGLSAFFLILNTLLAIDMFIKRKILDPLWSGVYQKCFTGRFGLQKIKLLRRSPLVLSRYLKNTSLSDLKQARILEFVESPLIPITRGIILNWFTVLALAWFALWPQAQSGGAYDVLERSRFSTAAKWVYYHESELARVYNKLELSAGMKRMKVREEKAAQDKWNTEKSELMTMAQGYYKGKPVSQKEILVIRKTLTMSAEDQKDILLKQYEDNLGLLEAGIHVNHEQIDVEFADLIKATKEDIERIEKE